LSASSLRLVRTLTSKRVDGTRYCCASHRLASSSSHLPFRSFRSTRIFSSDFNIDPNSVKQEHGREKSLRFDEYTNGVTQRYLSLFALDRSILSLLQQQQHVPHHNGKHLMTQRSLFSTSISPTAEEEEDLAYNSDRTSHNVGSSDSPTPASTTGGGLYRLLQPEERQILQEQRQLTKAVRQLQQEAGILASSSSSTADYDAAGLQESSSSISESAFCIVLAGEFNAGKSTVINALLGEKLLETGPLPTTDAITLLTSSNSIESKEECNNGEAKQQPYPSSIIHHEISNVPLLQDLTIVDTPGTNAVLLDHTATTMRLLPSADLILFVTSADRPFCESEREMLHDMAKQYRKAVVILINKMDIFDAAGGHYGQAEKKKVTDFVAHHAGELLGMSHPIVLPISSRDALSAKLLARQRQSTLSTSALEESAIWQRSNFAALETFLKETLTTETKIRSKLSSPIGVAQGILESCLRQVQKERTELESHVATLRLLQSHFSGWQSELLIDMNRMTLEMYDYLARQEGERGLVLLRRLSIWQYYRVCLLESTNHRLRNEWDKTRPLYHDVMANKSISSSIQNARQNSSSSIGDDIDPYLSTLIQEAAESVATRGRAQGQAVIEFLGQRPSSQNQSLIGSITAASTFEDTRQGLVDQMTRAVQRHVSDDSSSSPSSAGTNTKSSHDVRDGQAVLQTLQRWAYLSAGLNTGAVASLAMAAISSEFMDIVLSTGLAAVMAALSGLCLSHGRWNVARQYQEDWTSRAQGLQESLETVSRRELDRVDRRIQDGVAPYTRFVQAEQRRLDDLKAKCQELQSTAHRLRNRIHKLG
jgi:small GTP-binding protein